MTKKDKYIIAALCLAALLYTSSVFFALYPSHKIIGIRAYVDKAYKDGYYGWDMPCNYTKGSSSDNQQFLDCANGRLYEYIGTSPSVTFFNPDDEETNSKYCKEGEVATFTYDNPITGDKGDFADCINW